MKQTPLALLYFAFTISIALWVLSKTTVSSIFDSPLRSFTQVTAIIGATGFLIEYILSSRLPFVQSFLLPLDKAYKLHRIVGTLAVVGILFHVAGLLSSVLPGTVGLKLYLIPGGILSYTLGILAFYSMIVLVVTTFYLKLPYNIWKFVHKITGLTLPLIILHYLLVPSDISQTPYLKAWFITLGIFALIGWLYKLLLYSFVAYNHIYAVEEVHKEASITTITLKAVKNPLVVSAGQFAFFKVNAKNKTVSGESHPFSILDSSSDHLSISVKHLGDYTFRIQQLEVGDTVQVAGPYGGFGSDFEESEKPAVWIAGGDWCGTFCEFAE